MNDLRCIFWLGSSEENKSLPVEAIARKSVHKSQTPVSLCFTQSWQPPSDIAVRDMDDSGCIGQPPSYEKYDWMAAESFWETRETWSFFRRIQEAFRMDKAFMKSHHWLTSPRDLQYSKYVFSEAVTEVKAFRRQVKRGEFTPNIMNKRKATVYERYAHAMNEVEIWTDYRFSRTFRLPKA